jgi:hypothetical protein
LSFYRQVIIELNLPATDTAVRATPALFREAFPF